MVATGSGATLNYTPTEAGTFTIRLTATTNGANSTATKDLAVRAIDLQADPLTPGKAVLAVGGSVGTDIVVVTRGLSPGTLVVTMLSTVVTPSGIDVDLTIATIRPTPTGLEGSIEGEHNGVSWSGH